MRALFLPLILAAAVAAPPAQACRIPQTYPDEAAAQAARWRAFVGDAAVASLERFAGVRSCGGAGIDVEIAGYKAGLTTAAAQARFGTDAPLLGVLFADMILPGGAEVTVDLADRPVWEADFLFVVGDATINEAATRDQALAALRGYRPFIEIPRLGRDDGAPMTAQRLAAINVGAWRGVAGPERRLAHDAATVAALGAMRVRAFDGAGVLLGEGKGTDTLGHPLDAVLWVRDAVRAKGGRLRPGDVISIGAFTPLTPPGPGQAVTVRYEGLPGDPEVTARFRLANAD